MKLHADNKHPEKTTTQLPGCQDSSYLLPGKRPRPWSSSPRAAVGADGEAALCCVDAEEEAARKKAKEICWCCSPRWPEGHGLPPAHRQRRLHRIDSQIRSSLEGWLESWNLPPGTLSGCSPRTRPTGGPTAINGQLERRNSPPAELFADTEASQGMAAAKGAGPAARDASSFPAVWPMPPGSRWCLTPYPPSLSPPPQ